MSVSHERSDAAPTRGEGSTPRPLEVQDIFCDGRHTLVLSGELDLVSANYLESMIRHLCANGTRGIVLDLRKLTFIDSTGLHEIIAASRLCEANGYEFMLIPGPQAVQHVFEVAGLADMLPFEERRATRTPPGRFSRRMSSSPEL